MIIRREVSAYWDSASETIFINRSNPTRIQLSSLALVDRVATAVELLESLVGGSSGGGNTAGARRGQIKTR